MGSYKDGDIIIGTFSICQLLAICHLDLGSPTNTSLWTNDLKGTNLLCICKCKKNEGESEVNLTKGFGLLGLG